MSLSPGKSREGEPGQAAEQALAARTLDSLSFSPSTLSPPVLRFPPSLQSPSNPLPSSSGPTSLLRIPPTPQFSQEGQSFCALPLLCCDLLHLPVKWGKGGWLTTPQKTGFNIFQAALSHLIKSGPAGQARCGRVDFATFQPGWAVLGERVLGWRKNCYPFPPIGVQE